jgi:hypothetical protein
MTTVVEVRRNSQKRTKGEEKNAISIFRQLWAAGNIPLHRMYSSWEELEKNIEINSKPTTEAKRHTIHPCPYCGFRQIITMPLDGIFPYLNCETCERPFLIQKNLRIRKLTEEEKTEIPEAWIRIVDDLSKKKVAIVFKLE